MRCRFTHCGQGWSDRLVLPAQGRALASRTAKPVLVAAGKGTFAAAGTHSITVKLTAKGRQLLKKARRITPTAKGTFTTPGTPAITAAKSFAPTR